MHAKSLMYLIAVVLWVIIQVASAAAKSKKSQRLSSSQPKPPVQQARPVPQQFSAPVQSTPQQPQPYMPPRPIPQQQAPYVPQQQYGAYPPAANYGQGASPYGNPAPISPSPTYGAQGQSQFGQGQFGSGQYGANPAPVSTQAPVAYPAAQSYGQRDQDPYGQYGQSRQDTNQRYSQPGPQPQGSPSPANYPAQSQPANSPITRIQKTRAAQSPPATSTQEPLTNASGNRRKGVVSGLFTSPNAIVRAVILQEVLGPPKSKR